MKLIRADKQQLKQIKRLYKLSFPRTERKPFWLIQKKQREGLAEILAICDDDFSGLVTTLLHEDMALVEYFAIDSSKRGKGFGGEALRLIGERYAGKRLMLEIEEPNEAAANNNERIRRKNFYLRHGFSDANIPVKVFGVNMELLTYNCEITFPEYQKIYISTMGRYSKRFFTERRNRER